MNAAPARSSGDLRLIEDTGPASQPGDAPWRVLVVDDDPEVHAVTRLALGELSFDGRSVEVLSAHDGAEARRVLAATPDVALILLDVVMETEHAGLDFVRHVREEVGNQSVRIVLRTGQPGQAPARQVVARYEIDDYRTKTELTFERLSTLVLTALRAYRLLRRMETQHRELLHAHHELERFAYVASHDLQTPLRGIIGFAQLLERREGPNMPPESRELLDYILRSGRELHALIADLLEFSRLGRAAAVLSPVSLNSVVARAASRLQSTIADRGAQLTVGELPVVHGNAGQLEQLFCNLIENGIKFQPGAQPRVDIQAQLVAEGWEVRVKDYGIGIETEYLEKIFEPFRRLHPPDEFPGTGIGLAICRKVVTLHGGTLRAASAPGQGTTFHIVLPQPRE